MHLIFRGDPNELESGRGLSRQSITLEGVTFPMNVAVDASSLPDKLKAKLAKNAHFEVVADATAEATSAESAASADDAEEAAEVAALKERISKKRAAKE